MALDTAILWMVIMLLLGVVIGMTLAQKHIPAVLLLLLLATAIVLVIYVSLGGHALRFQ